MDAEELIRHAKSLEERARLIQRDSFPAGIKAEICEFLRTYAGPRSEFYLAAKQIIGVSTPQRLAAIMDSFAAYVTEGLHSGVSPERRAQIDVVSDFLDQAQRLLEQKEVHPAAPAVLIGATLEEFLRTWVEAEELSIDNRKRGIDAYATVLRTEDLIDKQDQKNITAWAGIRNHAAHGDWEKVANKELISLMLQGVNLFMSKRSG